MNTAKFFYRGPLGTGVTTLFTCPTGATQIITNIVVLNKDAVSNTATVTMGGLTLLPTITLAANSVATFDIRQVITAALNVTGYSSSGSNQVVIHISGVEQT